MVVPSLYGRRQELLKDEILHLGECFRVINGPKISRDRLLEDLCNSSDLSEPDENRQLVLLRCSLLPV